VLIALFIFANAAFTMFFPVMKWLNFLLFNEQFAPGSSSEVLITSADSRVRVVDGIDLVHKFKGT